MCSASAGWGGCAIGMPTPSSEALFERSPDDHLLLLEHPHVFTLGVRADLGHLLTPPADIGAELVRTDRGGDITYHGPGQLVGYPILALRGKGGRPNGLADTRAYVTSVEQLLIDVLGGFGLEADRLRGYPGVWVGAGTDRLRKIAAIGVRLTRGGPCTGSLSTWNPTCPTSTPSSPVASPTRRSPRWRPRASKWRCGGRRRRRGSGGCALGRGWMGAPGRRLAAGPADLAPFSRGEGPGRCPGRGRPSVCEAGSPRRGSVRGWRSTSASPSGSGRTSASGPAICASSGTCGISIWSRSVKRRAARTSPSAGPTARPRS